MKNPCVIETNGKSGLFFILMSNLFIAISILLTVGSCDTTAKQPAIEQIRMVGDNPQLLSDKLFVIQEHYGGMRERALAEIVLQNTKDAEMKELARVMQQGHQLGIDKLVVIAKDLNISLPAELTAIDQEKLNLWRKLPADELTRYYLIHQRAQHAWDITIFSDYTNFAVNDKLKKYIQETIQPLLNHAGQVVKFANTKGIEGSLYATDGKNVKDPAGTR